jgi:F0F1-type ATP synthase membrane subunit a
VVVAINNWGGALILAWVLVAEVGSLVRFIWERAQSERVPQGAGALAEMAVGLANGMLAQIVYQCQRYPFDSTDHNS